MDKELYSKYVRILKEELVPAMGCTEPIAIAYAAAKARAVLGETPISGKLEVSGNIVKNAKSVVVPHTGGLKGLKTAFAAGLVAGNADAELEVLSNIGGRDLENIKRSADTFPLEISVPETAHIFDIAVTLNSEKHSSYLRIVNSHTNIVLVKKDGKVITECVAEEERKNSDRAELNVKSILEFADAVDIADVKETLDRQIEYNMAIAEEGLKGNYGANVGKVLLRSYQPDIKTTAKAYAAAGSDARMNGCELPVVINSGSGNQGITASVPVIVYARGLNLPNEKLYRALCVSNLITVRVKTAVGTLSA